MDVRLTDTDLGAITPDSVNNDAITLNDTFLHFTVLVDTTPPTQTVTVGSNFVVEGGRVPQAGVTTISAQDSGSGMGAMVLETPTQTLDGGSWKSITDLVTSPHFFNLSPGAYEAISKDMAGNAEHTHFSICADVNGDGVCDRQCSLSGSSNVSAAVHAAAADGTGCDDDPCDIPTSPDCAAACQQDITSCERACEVDPISAVCRSFCAKTPLDPACDTTPPSQTVLDLDGTVVAPSGVVGSSGVMIEATDAGSGVASTSVGSDTQVSTPQTAADFSATFEPLSDGSYAALSKDKAGNQAGVGFTICANPNLCAGQWTERSRNGVRLAN